MKSNFLRKVFVLAVGLLFAALPAGAKKENTALAEAARETAPWVMPDVIYRNYVLPATSVEEPLDDWRAMFREKFLPLVKDCKTPTEAAETLNQKIWEILGVRYSPLRERPDQSPFHSMRIGKASCTGLSILLINACRSVGVPARFVGCRWKNKPGNHSWVEIWDDGEWFHLGAGDCVRVNEAWFNADAAQADPNDPKYAIYAACAEPTGLMFPAAWRSNGTSDIPALNVTERYLRLAQVLPSGTARVSFDLRSCAGERIAREIVVFDAESGKELARGNTHDNRFDLNDHLNFTFPKKTKLRVAPADSMQSTLAEFTVSKKDEVVPLRLP